MKRTNALEMSDMFIKKKPRPAIVKQPPSPPPEPLMYEEQAEATPKQLAHLHKMVRQRLAWHEKRRRERREVLARAERERFQTAQRIILELAHQLKQREAKREAQGREARTLLDQLLRQDCNTMNK